ncbi:HAD-like protein [Stereum hirsutum FP-91666 SS1]|uniref:HAD-like protein n=1 Tax=Stereum hirsutum (strain FP-91666) TaxID=721885 RepID=UPI000444A2F6|nr:HAD-like protein [Stereum hirsutum FP-91666 SS1]EIM80888.1 HAD-like protein [Stereum hirsutum FP-91666 SS1]
MSSVPTFDTLIFDLGDVLFTWAPDPLSPVTPTMMYRILRTTTWFNYERGDLSQIACYEQAARQMGVTVQDIASAFRAAQQTLTFRTSIVDIIRELRPGRKIYAMSNMSAPDWQIVQARFSDWDIFDGVFVSAEVGTRKPDFGFYRHILEQTGADASRTIFIDDLVDNVLVARSFGMTGIVYQDVSNLEQLLRCLCFDPVERAQAFMRANAKQHVSYTSDNQTIEENFTQLLILEATGDSSLVDYVEYDGLFNFFRGAGQLTTKDYPYDSDTSAIGVMVAPHLSLSSKHRILDDILHLRNADGIVQVYFDPSRPRVDPVICVNVLAAFYSNGRGNELKETFEWVLQVLKHRALLNVVSPKTRGRITPLFAERCRERLGASGDALALAIRVICCNQVGIDPSTDRSTLCKMQDVDGGWKDGWFYRYPTTGMLIGNRGCTTALAINAIKGARTPTDSTRH